MTKFSRWLEASGIFQEHRQQMLFPDLHIPGLQGLHKKMLGQAAYPHPDQIPSGWLQHRVDVSMPCPAACKPGVDSSVQGPCSAALLFSSGRILWTSRAYSIHIRSRLQQDKAQNVHPKCCTFSFCRTSTLRFCCTSLASTLIVLPSSKVVHCGAYHRQSRHHIKACRHVTVQRENSEPDTVPSGCSRCA